MEQEKKLYPFRFCTLQDDWNWGSETFKLADLGYRDSLIREGWLAGNSIGEVMDMYVDRVVGEFVFDRWGRQFPVCVRQLSCKGKMPLRVNPDDSVAVDRYDFLGKEKLWYIVRAGKDAKVHLGFRRDTDASELLGRCEDGSIADILNTVAPHAGQYFHIAPGTVHGAEGEIEIVEIAESSPLDFCLYSWGQEVSPEEFDPELNIVEALDFITYTAWSHEEGERWDGLLQKLMEKPQLAVSRLKLTDAVKTGSTEFDSFILYTCVKGAASVQMDVFGQTARFPFSAGDTILIPAENPEFALVPDARDTVLLETTVPQVDEEDSYINPAAAPALEGEDYSTDDEEEDEYDLAPRFSN